uniref:Uncharacterized protein n=1 Tax=uncultured Thiotrichaceae bacterium TaxID=298394 RepID=A0A6S6U0N4_9GAMM|nr:MAG: FIG00989860: hypothetical protein [uncultured Thiotrichaceae bacterium]
MQHTPKNDTHIPRRPPEQVMRLERMGSAHQGRLSFMRTLLRRLKRDKWTFERTVWEIDDQGVGRAVYQMTGPERTYSLVAFAHDLPPESRSDRVIAEAWDSTFALFDGVPTEVDLQRLEENVPKQEAGRVTASELTLSRANRSVRLFNYVADTLAAGHQPDREQIESVGYLMRTTAVYGSGKFGAADRDLIWQREEMAGPFQAEMLSVWLIRAFTLDLVEHMAVVKGGDQAVALEPDLRRSIGVGNSTGLGMAPFLMNHPLLLNNWMMAREEAIARVRSIQQVDDESFELFRKFLGRFWINADQWQSDHPLQLTKIASVKSDIRRLQAYLIMFKPQADYGWNRLYQWAKRSLSIEGQEMLTMLMLEPYPELVDALADGMNADEQYLPVIKGQMTVAEMGAWLAQYYGWALKLDFSPDESRSRFWYVSEEKLEPRLGERFSEEGGVLEQPLCIGWHVHQLAGELAAWGNQDDALADFLLAHPEYRHVVRRTQQADKAPYMEIQDNLIGADMLPIDLLRLKLSFFGATKFDPRSDRWVRITMFQHALFPHELQDLPANDWVYPPLN